MECVECGRRLDASQRTGRPRRYCSRSCQGRAYRRRRDDGRVSPTVRATPTDPRSETVLDVAVAIADAEGTDAVTLRSVASRAGLALIEVQRDFGSRDRLIATMTQHVLASRTRPPDRIADRADRAAPVDPVAVLTHLGENEWAAYRAHPWLVAVLASVRPPLVPAVLDASRAAIDVFVGSGLDSDTALDRYLAFSAYIQGMGLLLTAEQQEPARSGASYRAWWRAELRRLERTGATVRHPWLASLADRPDSTGFDVDASFRDGLKRVVRGLVQDAAS